MGEWRNAALQAAFWTYANSLRREAKLCDIILYVQGRKGAMVGYPAHKLLLISASKYFKLLFEREDLRNFCHFPHLSEDGLFTVLDIVYGREIADNVNLDDALMAARFLQVDCAVEELEAKRVSLETKARVSPRPKPVSTGIKRKAVSSSPADHHHHYVDRAPSRERLTPSNDSSHHTNQQTESAEVRLFRNIKNQGDEESNNSQSFPSGDSPASHEENSMTEPPDEGGGGMNPQQMIIKSEPDVDLTIDDENAALGFSQANMSLGNQGFGQMAMDNISGQSESGLGMFGSYGTGESGATFGDPGMFGEGTFLSGSDGSQTSPDKKRQCDICGKVFATVKHLEEHRATHTGMFTDSYTLAERPYACDICGSRFKKKYHMDRHRLNSHSEVRPFQCSLCPKTFKRQDHLQVHMATHVSHLLLL